MPFGAMQIEPEFAIGFLVQFAVIVASLVRVDLRVKDLIKHIAEINGRCAAEIKAQGETNERLGRGDERIAEHERRIENLEDAK